MKHETLVFLLAFWGWMFCSSGMAEEKLSGQVIGTEASIDYATGAVSTEINGRDCAFDGNLQTFFASYERSNTWVGLDLGKPHIITRVGWAPRNEANYGPKRVVLGLFEGANQPDFSDALPLYLIDAEGEIGEMHYAAVPVTRGFRYVRYVGPNDARCNVAEVEFYGHAGEGTDEQFYQITNLPTISIHTENQTDPYDKVHQLQSHIALIYEDGRMMQEGGATTRLRGNASLHFAKKPYRIKFDEKKRMLKGSPLASPAKARKWTLISNYGDKSLMRNIVAQEMSRRLKMAYTPWSQSVDLLLNGEYKGTYQLTDQITINEDRVDIDELSPEDVQEPSLAGGYIIECDAYAGSEPAQSRFNSQHGVPVTIKFPGSDDIQTQQHDYIQSHFNLLESRLYGASYEDPEKGYRSLLDVESFLKHLLINEFAGNSDTYWSTYMYKDRNEDQFHVGPVWDFDDGLDNDNRTYPVSGKSDFIFRYIGIYAGTMPDMANRILSDPEAEKLLRLLWCEAREQGVFTQENMLAYVDSLARDLDASQQLNFKRWDILNSLVHQNFQALGSYDAEVNTVRNYLKQRVRWLDRKLGYGDTEEPTETMQITSADDWMDFAAAVNSGQTMLDAVLTCDLDLTQCGYIPAGSKGCMYAGTFDGQGHCITLQFSRASENAALFEYVTGTIRNLVTRGTIATSSKYAGGIAARIFGANIENCASYVNIEATIQGDGTHGGIVGVADGGGTVQNCLYAGTMRGSQTTHCGGIVGWATTATTIRNCIQAGTLRVGTTGSHTLCRNYQVVTSQGNYYRSTLGDVGNEARTTTYQLSTGNLCYRINQGITDGTQAWYQNLDNGESADATPVPLPTHGTVYLNDNVYTNQDPTGISRVESRGSTSPWYDLLGRKVARPQGKGIYFNSSCEKTVHR